MPPCISSLQGCFNLSSEPMFFPPLGRLHFRASHFFLPVLNSVCIPSRFLPLVVKSIHNGSQQKQKSVVFLGTPNDAANTLETLLDAAENQGSIFKIVAVVSQPQSSSHPGRKHAFSPVAQRALDRGFPLTSVFLPMKAGEEGFLSSLKGLQPDLCVTAAYGNILPKKFLDIPPYGTVNIHPSLLPLYRGAAPVQRAIQDGVKVTGVTIAYTVRALDSGPIISRENVEVDPDIKAPELQSLLFAKGTRLLLKDLPRILDGSAAKCSKEQDHALVSLAPKIGVEESWLSFNETALVIHNKVRAFSGWPGTKALFHLESPSGEIHTVELKVITTRVQPHDHNISQSERSLQLKGNSLIVGCGSGTTLEIVELQPPGKKVMSGRDFWNGLQGRRLLKISS